MPDIKRRSLAALEAAVRKAAIKYGKIGGSIREIAVEAGINWRTTKNILERFERLGLIENVVTHKRLKIYRWRRK